MECNTIALIRNEQHLRSERRADELSTHAACAVLGVLAALLRGNLLEHLRDRRAVLGVEVGVNFIEEVEGCWIALLDGEDEGEGAQT